MPYVTHVEFVARRIDHARHLPGSPLLVSDVMRRHPGGILCHQRYLAEDAAMVPAVPTVVRYSFPYAASPKQHIRWRWALAEVHDAR